MAEVRPLRALRYAPHLDLGLAICPPFDVISPQQRQRLASLSPYNAVRLELPQDGGDPYGTAAELLHRWRAEGILQRDDRPALYVLEQSFVVQGREYRRRALFARVRLVPWEEGAVRPHEHTLRPPKEDRLRLLRALRTQVSPVFGLCRDQRGALASLLDDAAGREPLARFAGPEGCRCALWALEDEGVALHLAQALADESIYIADGHHRYETGLAYLEERRSQAECWTGEEPENFVLMGLVAAQDPGLLLLPLHRLVRSDVPLERALEALVSLFDIETVPSLGHLLGAIGQRGRAITTFGLASAESPDLYLLSVLDVAAVTSFMPAGSPRQWAHIDTAVVQHAVLGPVLGIGEDRVREGEVVQYTTDAEDALRQVREGKFRYAFFVGPARPAQIMSVADAGARMPPKSTYFYPKLPAGLVMYPLEP
ncbi:MAG TPA: DUF1015 domain-containing protein [Dehalococcoidia bacterium]|nr:DUF1015 domain-containing protein [Dehalococcoidia bacterium]